MSHKEISAFGFLSLVNFGIDPIRNVTYLWMKVLKMICESYIYYWCFSKQNGVIGNVCNKDSTACVKVLKNCISVSVRECRCTESILLHTTQKTHFSKYKMSPENLVFPLFSEVHGNNP